MEKIVDYRRELLLGLLVKVRDGDSSSKDSIIWVGDCHVCRCLGGLCNKNKSASRLVKIATVLMSTYQIIQLNGSDTLVDTRDNLLCDCCGVYMVGIQPVAQS